MGRVYNNNLFYYIQMDYLTLSIRCILPKHAEKNFLLKIHNRQLDIHIQLQNTFVHNYEYVYKLWPCEIGYPHTIQLQLLEKGEGQTMKLRGVAQAKLFHTYEGELYKFYGNRSQGQVYLMCFKVEKAQGEQQLSKQQAQLRKMNSQMQQSLLKYKEEIKNYQEFLYFTNNVIKQLNKDSDQSPQNSPSNQKYSPRSPIMINQIKSIPREKSIDVIPTKRRRESIQINEKQTQRIKTINVIQENPNKQLQQSETISQNCFVKGESRASKSKVGSYLSKYRYLQQIQQSRLDSEKESNVSMSQVRQKTPVKRLIEQTQIESPQILQKRKKQFQITSKIRQRRQHYFMLDELKQVQQQMVEQNRSSVQTPINQLSSNLASKISKNSQKYQRNIFQAQTCEEKQPQRVNKEASAKGSTRSQTGLKQMLLYSQKKHSLRDYVKQSKQQMQAKNKLKQTTQQKRSQARSAQQLNLTNMIIKSVAAPVRSTNNEQLPIRQEPNLSQNQSIIQNIARRRKVIAKNSASILGQMEDINHSIVHKGIRNEDLTGCAVSKLTIYGLKSIFYANFKSSTKKCIIEHNGQVYQTDLQRNNLKNTTWNERIVLNALKPTEDLIFMIYSIRKDQVELEGTGIVKIIQVLSSQQRHFKFYLYFDNIAVGSIEFDVQRERRNYKRLSVSLPQIKSKSPPKQQFAVPKTIRTKTQSDQSSKIESNPSQQRQSSQTAQFNQYSSNSEFNQHEIYMPNNNQITKKVRNIKLTKLSRLGKPK